MPKSGLPLAIMLHHCDLPSHCSQTASGPTVSFHIGAQNVNNYSSQAGTYTVTLLTNCHTWLRTWPCLHTWLRTWLHTWLRTWPRRHTWLRTWLRTWHCRPLLASPLRIAFNVVQLSMVSFPCGRETKRNLPCGLLCRKKNFSQSLLCLVNGCRIP